MLTAVCFMGCQQEDIVYPEPDAKVAETYLTLNELTQSLYKYRDQREPIY